MPRPQQRPQKPAKPVEPAPPVEEKESPFRHYVPGEKLRTDPAYFELLMVTVFRAGGDVAEFDELWPRVVHALAGMNLLRLSTYTPGEVSDAITTVGGPFAARMGSKSALLVEWAGAFWRIRQIYGSFRQYVRSFEAEGFEALLNDLRGRLGGLTPEFLTEYLKLAGEKPPAPERLAAPARTEQPQRTATGARRETAADAPRQPQKDGERPDRRRQRQRQRSGQRPASGQTSPSRDPQPQAQVASQATDADPNAQPVKDGQQQRRRRNRRFFRRNRGGDKSGSPGGSAPTTG